MSAPRRLLAISALVCALVAAASTHFLAAESSPTAKPEDVGLSSERLLRVNEMMQRHIAKGDISGGVTLVARKGRIAHLDAFGVMDLETKKPMPKDAAFRIMSMTKPVTGVAILMMMEEGKLRITDPVSKYIPEFKEMKVAVAQPNAGPTPAAQPAAGGRAGGAPTPRFYTVPAEREITIRDLLTHTSGLVSGTMSSSTARDASIARKPTDALADYIPRLGKTALEFQPGSRWAYSAQAGMDTLGRIVEIV